MHRISVVQSIFSDPLLSLQVPMLLTFLPFRGRIGFTVFDYLERFKLVLVSRTSELSSRQQGFEHGT